MKSEKKKKEMFCASTEGFVGLKKKGREPSRTNEQSNNKSINLTIIQVAVSDGNFIFNSLVSELLSWVHAFGFAQKEKSYC